MKVKADHYAKLAIETLNERGEEYGDYRTLFKIMAERFSRHSVTKQAQPITDLEACMHMIELKLSRIEANQKNPEDSVKDAIGYLSIYGGLLESKKKTVKQD